MVGINFLSKQFQSHSPTSAAWQPRVAQVNVEVNCSNLRRPEGNSGANCINCQLIPEMWQLQEQPFWTPKILWKSNQNLRTFVYICLQSSFAATVPGGK